MSAEKCVFFIMQTNDPADVTPFVRLMVSEHEFLYLPSKNIAGTSGLLMTRV